MGKINKKLAPQKVQLMKSKQTSIIKNSKPNPRLSKSPPKPDIKLEKPSKRPKGPLKPAPDASNITDRLDLLAKNIQMNLAAKDSKPLNYIEESNLSREQVTKSTDALLSWLSNQKKDPKLFAESLPIFLQVVCVKIPKCARFTTRISIPNSLLTPTSDVCLFVGDLHKGRKTDHEPTIQHYEDLLQSKGIKNIKNIIPMRQVKTEYDQFELRRRLVSLYDYFLTDAKIAKHLNKKLGKIFLKQRKSPIPVNFEQGDLKDKISKALNKTSMRIHPDGDTFMVQVGHTQLKPEQIVANILAVGTKLEDKFPGGFGNVRSLHLKGDLSPAIPVYISLKLNADVETPVVKPKRPKSFVPVEGELTTINDLKVRVQPTGEVKVLNGFNPVSDKKTTVKRLKPKKKQNKKVEKKQALQQNKEVTNGIGKADKRKIKVDSDSEDDAIINTAEEQYLSQYSSELKENKRSKGKKLKKN